MYDYRIRFEQQVRDGFLDYESGSIYLTTKEYFDLPELSAERFPTDCKISKGEFPEPVRSPYYSLPAVFIKNDKWIQKKKDVINPEFYWVFVCIDVEKDFWIAFEYGDAVDVGEAYGTTVGVSFPWHGDVYRLDESCMKIVRKFY